MPVKQQHTSALIRRNLRVTVTFCRTDSQSKLLARVPSSFLFSESRDKHSRSRATSFPFIQEQTLKHNHKNFSLEVGILERKYERVRETG